MNIYFIIAPILGGVITAILMLIWRRKTKRIFTKQDIEIEIKDLNNSVYKVMEDWRNKVYGTNEEGQNVSYYIGDAIPGTFNLAAWLIDTKNEHMEPAQRNIVTQHNKMLNLKLSLVEALADEKYERAAELRDMIIQEEKKTKNDDNNK